MEEQALISEPESAEAPTKVNRGWFRSGDPRINRAGRPKPEKAAAKRAQSGKRQHGPIRKLFVPAAHLETYLTHRHGPWLINLPASFSIVGCEWDLERDGAVLTIHSYYWDSLQPGEPIPELDAKYHGLKFVRRPLP